MQAKKITIAIDGHSSSGKSTISKQLAAKLGYKYIDTGAMYRAVTLYALRKNLIHQKNVDKDQLINELSNIKISFRYNTNTQRSDTYLNGENVENEIRELEVSNNVSPVATIKEVRQAMVKMQQEMGKEKEIVMDGRDIGTVVFPDAELKIFLTASTQVRAQRRYDELKAKGLNVSFDEVLSNIEERDHIDSTRDESPLVKADDALVLDNSHLNPDEQIKYLLEKVEGIRNAH
ncbi:MAG: (d)CMP kinase [Prolixibacteraceae bacterium]|nr:(d)CMP kinase [Prolixibacteraceae bacterium]MBN2650647.1 (d)CMP kinase [Prolixibacteraceae bacterium]